VKNPIVLLTLKTALWLSASMWASRLPAIVAAQAVTSTPAPAEIPPHADSVTETPPQVESNDAQTPPATEAKTPTHTRYHLDTVGSAESSTLGSIDPQSGYKFKVALSSYGAAIRDIWLTDYHQTFEDLAPYAVQSPIVANPYQIYPFAARAVKIGDERVPLESAIWKLLEPGRYQVTVLDTDNQPVLRITRHYSVRQDPRGYDVKCVQLFENLSGQPLQVTWEQYAQGDVPNDDAKYLGDRRTLMAGYYDLDYDPYRHSIYTKNATVQRNQFITGTAFWPNDKLPAKRELVWLASLNRYFAATVYVPLLDTIPSKDPASDQHDPPKPLDIDFPHLGKVFLGSSGPDQVMAMTLTSRTIEVPVGGSKNLDLALYAGPRKSEVFNAEPFSRLDLSHLVIYELGCTLCTFQPLAKGLLGFLKVLHTITFDWAISIIILVVVVRLILHPITRRSQINMMKMSKQMQSLQPEIEKLKKKYKDDQKTFQAEQVKLWREKGVNPANMLGCLPMFLQTPIWVALYAMLYYAIELRHQPALYGIFQWISNGRWGFLGDLSNADNFIRFSGQGVTIPLYFVNPTFSGINLIPILMVVVFYYQQKLSTPPPATPEAAQQQKMMKYMTLIFPVFLYSAPSGLTLYILASTFAGIVDSTIVRRHIKEQEEAGTLFDKKPPKPGGLMDRIQKSIEAKQREMQMKKDGGGTKRRNGR
jgi:YidC/Oxa1 family membrane protein insertase